MTCKHCTLSKQQPHYGVYNFACLECCARLVLTTKPDKQKAASMLEAISRFDGAPARSDVLQRLKNAPETLQHKAGAG